MYWMYNYLTKEYVIEATENIYLELYNLSEDDVDLLVNGHAMIIGYNNDRLVRDFEPEFFGKGVLSYEDIDEDYSFSPFTAAFLTDMYEEELQRSKEDEEHKRLERTY